jgi:hypothetical protein
MPPKAAKHATTSARWSWARQPGGRGVNSPDVRQAVVRAPNLDRVRDAAATHRRGPRAAVRSYGRADHDGRRTADIHLRSLCMAKAEPARQRQQDHGAQRSNAGRRPIGARQCTSLTGVLGPGEFGVFGPGVFVTFIESSVWLFSLPVASSE